MLTSSLSCLSTVQIPVNCPFLAKQYHPPNRDGQMRVDSNGGAEAHYFFTSFTSPPAFQPDKQRAGWTVRHIQGALARTSHSRSAAKHDDEYIQAREFFLHDMTEQDRANLFRNTAIPLAKVTKVDIVARYLICMHKVDPTGGRHLQGLPPHHRAEQGPARACRTAADAGEDHAAGGLHAPRVMN